MYNITCKILKVLNILKFLKYSCNVRNILMECENIEPKSLLAVYLQCKKKLLLVR